MQWEGQILRQFQVHLQIEPMYKPANLEFRKYKINKIFHLDSLFVFKVNDLNTTF